MGVDLAPRREHPENGAHRIAVERESPEAPGDPEGTRFLGHGLGIGRQIVTGHHHLDDPVPSTGRRVHHHRSRIGQRPGQRQQRLVGQPVTDLSGFGVAHEHGVDHLVHRTGARRVVGRVANGLLPGHLQQRPRPPLGRQVQSAVRLGPPLEGPFGPGRLPLHVDPVRGHPHEDVGPCPRAQLAPPPRQSIGRRAGQVVGQRRHLQHVVVLEVVGLGHHPPEPRLRFLVVRPVHEQQSVDEEVPDLLLVVGDPPHELLGVVGDGRPVAVADR